MIESFGNWIINPCGNIETPYLVRGENLFIGYIPDSTPTSNNEIFTVLLNNIPPQQNEYIDSMCNYTFALRFFGNSYFPTLDFADKLHKDLFNIKGAIIPEVDNEQNFTIYEFLVSNISLSGNFSFGLDSKNRFIFQNNIFLRTQKRISNNNTGS